MKTPVITTACRVLVCLAFLIVVAPAAGAQNSGAIAQGFTADNQNGEIVPGALVSGKDNDSGSVELASATTADRLVGVVDKSPLVALSKNTDEVQVVLSGATWVLVSDINGKITASDKITPSPIAGIGMLATSDSQIVGTAQADLDMGSAETRTITDSKGKAHQVHIGFVPLQVGVAYYQAPGSNFLPPFIQSIANSIAGRPVSLIRILLCSFLLVFGFIGVTVLVYTSVRSAITSVGRNPLAAGAIRKSLYQVVLVAFVVLGGALLASYLILSV